MQDVEGVLVHLANLHFLYVPVAENYLVVVQVTRATRVVEGKVRQVSQRRRGEGDLHPDQGTQRVHSVDMIDRDREIDFDT